MTQHAPAIATLPPQRRPVPPPIGVGPADPLETNASIDAFAESLLSEEPFVAGFPGNLMWDYQAYAKLLSVLSNTVGDPDSPDASSVGAKGFERQIVNFMTDFTRGDRHRTYAYVTNGGSEGNLFGLLTARNTLPNAPVYVTAATHYSVTRAAELLRMRLITVPTRPDDTMDPDALRDLTRAHQGGAILAATIGTTMLGGNDDLHLLRQVASAAGPVYTHVDCALGGWLAPYASLPVAFDFHDGADSLSFSAHKLPGHPEPTGIVLARRHLVTQWPAGQYASATDHTLSCSRSGLAIAVLWIALRHYGYEGLRRLAEDATSVAEHADHRLTDLGLDARRRGITVSFPLPGRQDDWKPLRARWHLPAELRGNGDTLLTHVITVPHITRARIDALVEDTAAVLAGSGR